MRPEGGKWWRLRYRFNGKEKLLSLGVYPEVPLAVARQRRDDARKAEKASRTEANSNAFEPIAREWYATRKNDWAPSYGEKIIRRLELGQH